jgi:hypothetical protein
VHTRITIPTLVASHGRTWLSATDDPVGGLRTVNSDGSSPAKPAASLFGGTILTVYGGFSSGATGDRLGRRRPLPLSATLGLLGLLLIILVVVRPLPWALSLLSYALVSAALLVPARLRHEPVDHDGVTESLARAVRVQWESEMRHLRIYDPFPLSVPWTSSVPLADHWIGSSATDTVGQLPAYGRSLDVADLFGRIPSRRLVILGAPGAGKSVLAQQLVLRFLDERSSGDPVPVLLPISTWDPTTRSYPAWLVERLAADYPGLSRRTASDRTLAQDLVDQGRVLPLLDSLDELPPDARAEALRGLNSSLSSRDSLVLFCRTGEYAGLVESGGVLRRAAVIELAPLSPEDVIQFLGSGTSPRLRTELDPLLGTMRDPSHPLARALDSPLMVGLCRTVYGDNRRSLMELLDPHRFPDAGSIKEWLVQAWIPSRGRGLPRSHTGGDPVQVERWLSFLALHLSRSGRDSLAWWELEWAAPWWVPAGTGALLVGAGVGAAVGASGGGPIPGLAAAALSSGAATGIGFALRRRSPDGSRVASFPSLQHRAGLTRALLVGLVGGSPLGLAAARAGGGAFGAVTGLLLCVSLGLTAWLAGPGTETSLPSPWGMVRASRLFAVSSWLTLALSLGVSWSLAMRLSGADDVTVGLVAGAATVPWLTSATAWGRFTTARLWLAARGVLPWGYLRFLEEMHRRGLMRRTGASYRFAHAHLLMMLANRYVGSGLARGATGR